MQHGQPHRALHRKAELSIGRHRPHDVADPAALPEPLEDERTADAPGVGLQALPALVGAEHEEALGEAAEPRDDCIQLAGLAQHVDAPEALQDALRPLSRVSSTRTGSIDIFRPSSVTCRRRSSG